MWRKHSIILKPRRLFAALEWWKLLIILATYININYISHWKTSIWLCCWQKNNNVYQGLHEFERMSLIGNIISTYILEILHLSLSNAHCDGFSWPTLMWKSHSFRWNRVRCCTELKFLTADVITIVVNVFYLRIYKFWFIIG